MRTIAVLVIAGCGAKPVAPPANRGSDEVPSDPRPEIVKRRDTACDQLGPRLYDCAVADARAAYAAGDLKRSDLDALLKPELREAYLTDWTKKCRVDMSSRQVRVLEVCYREERECDPLNACLANLQPAKPKP